MNHEIHEIHEIHENKSEGLVPGLRFPEFRDAGEWKIDILKNISPSIFDGTHQTPKYIESGIPFFSVENIVSGNKNKFISREDYLVATSKNKPEKGDILITRIGNIGYSVVINWDYEFSIYVTLAVVKKSVNFNSNFLNCYFQSKRYQVELHSKSLLNAVPCKINMDELRKTEVLLPTEKEQQKIADCLSSLDELITAEAQKIDTLKAHKKGLMQQLFPAEGETVPGMRFPEFRDAGEWEKKELGQICEINNNRRKPVSSSDRAKGIYPYYGASGIVDYIDDYIFDERLLLVGEDGAKWGAFEKTAFIVDGKYWVNNHAHVLKPTEINDVLLENYLIKLDISPFITGAAPPKLTLGKLKAIPIPFPIDRKEQQKIADCLSSLDKLITAQAQKIDTLKAHKKGLMQGLFPSADEVGV